MTNINVCAIICKCDFKNRIRYKMKKYHSHYIKNLLIPCLVFSIITGVISSLFVVVFKIASSYVVELSERLYEKVQLEPRFLPLLIAGALLMGFIASLIITFSHSCRGGGIPTSIAAIRGIVNFNWVKSIFFLPISALITFLVGVPLGTEGPCVQMGTASSTERSSSTADAKHMRP